MIRTFLSKSSLLLLIALAISWSSKAGCTYSEELYGSYQNNIVVLNWSTHSEHNNHFFLVERSLDGFKFERVVQIEGNGNSIDTRQYRCTDLSQKADRAYYRLLQVDYDGKMQISHTIVISKYTSDQLFAIKSLSSTQPVRYFSISLDSKAEGMMSYRIMDMLGKLLIDDSSEVIAGHNRLSLDLADIPVGSYQFALKIDNEIEVFNFKRANDSGPPDSPLATSSSKQ